MASRSGPRAAGSDGSDFNNREKVVNHYKMSASLKVKLKKSLIPHMLMMVMLVGKQCAVLIGSKYFAKLEIWEMVWIISGLSAFIGLSSLARNDRKRMMVYIAGNLLFGITPLIYGFMAIVKRIRVDFSDMRAVPDAWRNSPMKMALITVCFTWQVIGVVNGLRLMATWKSMSEKRNK